MSDLDQTKEIVNIAIQYFLGVMEESKTPIDDPRLEEVEKPQGEEKDWKITISYTERAEGNSFAAIYAKGNRIYKVLSVDPITKTVTSLKSL